MLRLSLATRLVLIVLLGLLLAWTLALAALYRASVRQSEGIRPSPARLAAVAELIERSPPDRRPLAMRATTSDGFIVRIEPARNLPAPPHDFDIEPDLPSALAAALGGRPFAITPAPPPPTRPLLWRLTRGSVDPVEVHVALRNGETLVVDTRSRLPVTAFGLPVGFGAGLLGTAIALIALLVMHRETKPLARLSAAVDRVDLSADPPPLPEARRSAPEIRALVSAFNRLQGRLSALLRARMAMVGGISHDVRTYATRLRLRIDRIPDDSERERAAKDIDDMIRLLDDAMLASRAGAGELADELVDFDEIVAAEVADAKANGLNVALRKPPAHAPVLGDRVALRRVVSNLVENAVKYGQAAQIELIADDSAIALVVDDSGPGIPDGQRAAVLEPFVRLETSRNRATGGAGLGLAIVRNLVEAHRGTVEIANAPSQGGRIVVRLPRFKTS